MRRKTVQSQWLPITGGSGLDELWGDFGANTFLSARDGYRDLIVIKSDQHLYNWKYGKAGNANNGEKVDIIEGLDQFDQIRILGISTELLSFAPSSAHGKSGIGIYAGGYLELLYTGTHLSIEQLQAMVTGDASPAAMDNSIERFMTW